MNDSEKERPHAAHSDRAAWNPAERVEQGSNVHALIIQLSPFEAESMKVLQGFPQL
jgi:hypothetical protein